MDFTNKIFVSAGCSFSTCEPRGPVTWPAQIQEILNPKEHISKGMGSQGNGLISRSIIYEVNRLLKQGVKNTDIVVGVMWSGYSRYDYYWDNTSRGSKWEPVSYDGWMYNPTNFNPNDNEGGWIIGNAGWRSCKEYYKYYYDHVGGQVATLEHVLRVQWFLEKHNINYFMMKYMDEVFNLHNKIPCEHLYEQIDWTKFVNEQGCYEWCKEKSDQYIDSTMHPTSEGHRAFTKSLIIPFMKSNIS